MIRYWSLGPLVVAYLRAIKPNNGSSRSSGP